MSDFFYPFVNKPLPYDYDALEPYIDTKTMHLHHDKHLQTYVDNLNKALTDYPLLQKMALPQLLSNPDKLLQSARTAIMNNGGGVYNHRFYFNALANPSIEEPIGELAGAINKAFGSFENFKSEFIKAALSVFGSGYAWLVLDGNGKLKIITTANQDTPLAMGLCPILNVDVWEHAYYLKHYNVRADYLNDWFNVVNWPVISTNYMVCTFKNSIK